MRYRLAPLLLLTLYHIVIDVKMRKEDESSDIIKNNVINDWRKLTELYLYLGIFLKMICSFKLHVFVKLSIQKKYKCIFISREQSLEDWKARKSCYWRIVLNKNTLQKQYTNCRFESADLYLVVQLRNMVTHRGSMILSSAINAGSSLSYFIPFLTVFELLNC